MVALIITTVTITATITIAVAVTRIITRSHVRRARDTGAGPTLQLDQLRCRPRSRPNEVTQYLSGHRIDDYLANVVGLRATMRVRPSHVGLISISPYPCPWSCETMLS